MLNIFIGVDVRQPIAFTVLQSSIIARASVPVAITPLLIEQLPITRRGLTDFTYTRYLPPYLMDFKGTALFLDADMVVLGDIAELFSLADPRYAVQVVKAKDRFEWPSLMLFNCEKCKLLTPDYIEHDLPQNLQFGEVGELPKEWNHCVGYDEPNPNAKLIHYTMGIPAFPEVGHLEHVDTWKNELKAANSTVSWEALMGKSVHAERLHATRW
jgi:lipopolysaccharide biosynthesis glycosyltransferase